MKDVVSVNMAEGKANLNKQLHDFLLGETSVRVLPFLDEHGQVTSVGILHHYKQLVVLDETLAMLNDVRVRHLAQDLRLEFGRLLSVGGEVADHDLLHDVLLSGGLELDQQSRPIAALAEVLDLPVLLQIRHKRDQREDQW